MKSTEASIELRLVQRDESGSPSGRPSIAASLWQLDQSEMCSLLQQAALREACGYAAGHDDVI